MPMTEKEVFVGEIAGMHSPRKLYLIPGEIMGVRVPQTLVALNETELAENQKIHPLIIEIGTAHPDLDRGIEWEVCGIRRRDIVELPGYLLKKGENNGVDSGVQQS